MSIRTQKNKTIPTPIPAPTAVPASQIDKSSPVNPSHDLDVSEMAETRAYKNKALKAIMTHENGLSFNMTSLSI